MPAAPSSVQDVQRSVLNDSTISTFGAICGAEPTLEGECGECADGTTSVQGIIAVVGDVSWSLSLAFPPETAEAIAQKFAGFEIPYESADMADVIGELANVMAGDVVARLDRKGLKVKMSLPNVARGESLHLNQPGASQTLKLRFKLPQGPMIVGMAVAKGGK